MEDDFETNGEVGFDPSVPLQGVIVCCTGISPEERQQIVSRTADLGGIHQFDLTPDVTHLLVGDFETEKYRHVARERPDVRPMDPGWIEDLTRLWKQDEPIDFAASEKQWQLQPFEISGPPPSTESNPEPMRRRLLISLTGFVDVSERNALQDTITSNGGAFTADLTKQCSHLVVAKPEGRKYKAARSWKLRTVSAEWVLHSIERGMILHEKYYDPTLPPEERGVGARVAPERVLAKRPRGAVALAEAEGRQRKLRKTASMKLSSQRNSFLGDLMAQKPQSRPVSRNDAWADVTARQDHVKEDDAFESSEAGNAAAVDQVVPQVLGDKQGVLSSSFFYVHGFAKQKHDVVAAAIKALGGRVCQSQDEVKRARAPRSPWHRFIVVPQDAHVESLGLDPDDVSPAQLVTEFFIEACMSHKVLFDPQANAIGRPFPVFPVEGFDKLVICTSGFKDIDLYHTATAIGQLGASFDERLKQRTSVVVCRSLELLRDDKKQFAISNGIPLVSQGWLWECITTGTLVPMERSLLQGIEQKLGNKTLERARSTPVIPVAKTKPSGSRPGSNTRPLRTVPRDLASGSDSRGSKSATDASLQYETAKTNLTDSRDSMDNRRLKELSNNSVVRSESPNSSRSKESTDSGGTGTKSDETVVAHQQELNEEEERRTVEFEVAARRKAKKGKEGDEEEEEEEGVRQKKKQEQALLQHKVASLMDQRLSDSTPGSSRSSADGGSAVPARKGRQNRLIQGRALSSISITSNHDDVGEEHVGGEGREMMMGGSSDKSSPAEEDISSFPMTQVEYVDPDAVRAQNNIKNRLKRLQEAEEPGEPGEPDEPGETKPSRASSRLRRTPARQ